MLAYIREENTKGTKLVPSVVPSVCRGHCAPNSGLLASISHKSALAVQPKMSHNSLISVMMDTVLTVASGVVTSQSWRLERTKLIVGAWMNTPERIKTHSE